MTADPAGLPPDWPAGKDTFGRFLAVVWHHLACPKCRRLHTLTLRLHLMNADGNHGRGKDSEILP